MQDDKRTLVQQCFISLVGAYAMFSLYFKHRTELCAWNMLYSPTRVQKSLTVGHSAPSLDTGVASTWWGGMHFACKAICTTQPKALLIKDFPKCPWTVVRCCVVTRWSSQQYLLKECPPDHLAARWSSPHAPHGSRGPLNFVNLFVQLCYEPDHQARSPSLFTAVFISTS